MRVAALIVIVLLVAVLAIERSHSPSGAQRAERGVGEGRFSPSPLGEGRGEGKSPSAPLLRSSATSRLAEGQEQGRIAQIPTPLPPAARLPATLELVTFPNLAGAPASSPPKSITRTEALASVMASEQFQETVTPLARLYFATFGRYPDYEGLNHYTGQREEARPLDAIATEFVGSREFQRLYGLLDNNEFVERMFVNILGHAAQ